MPSEDDRDRQFDGEAAELFGGVAAVEPSPRSDRMILAAALERQRRSGRRGFDVALVRVLLVAAAAVLVAGLFGLMDLGDETAQPASQRAWGVAEPAPAAASAGESAAHDAVRADVASLRVDLEEIEIESERIPAEKAADKDEIQRRVRACFADIEALELRLGLGRPEAQRRAGSVPFSGKERPV
jgi:hypothetical protein